MAEFQRILYLELHDVALEPMVMGPYGLRDPYCHVDYSKIGTMRSDDPWEGYCSPKIFQHSDGLFYIVQWRLNVSTGQFW